MDFFNDLGKKFSHAARSVQERSRESAEVTRLNASLSAARSELDSRLTELGRAYYEHVANAGAEVDESLICAVRECVARIETLSAQRDRARTLTRCLSCGCILPEEAHYCSNCGRPLPEPSPLTNEPVADAQYCVRCGAMREGETRFCPVCGCSFIPEDDPPALETTAPAPMPAPEEPTDTRAE